MRSRLLLVPFPDLIMRRTYVVHHSNMHKFGGDRMANLGRAFMEQVNFLVLGSTGISRPRRILYPVGCSTIVSNGKFVSFALVQ